MATPRRHAATPPRYCHTHAGFSHAATLPMHCHHAYLSLPIYRQSITGSFRRSGRLSLPPSRQDWLTAADGYFRTHYRSRHAFAMPYAAGHAIAAYDRLFIYEERELP